MIESLDVILWDKKVGTLVASREGHRSKACFYFDSDYVRDGYDIAPLRAPVKGVAAQRGLPVYPCLLYTSPSPRDLSTSRMPSSA